ncbi:MAG: RNA polymerase sigma factor [Acidimicrobiales bacterium]
MAVAETALLVLNAQAGAREAWAALVERFAGLVLAVARDYRLSAADAADVSQTTWLRLAEHLDRLREPERVGVWLATTARNESLRVLRRSQRDIPVDPVTYLSASEDLGPEVDRRILDEERDSALWRAFEALPPTCKVLLRTLMAEPQPSYAEVSATLGMKVGSIGPTRKRCLQSLRQIAELGADGIVAQTVCLRRKAG